MLLTSEKKKEYIDLRMRTAKHHPRRRARLITTLGVALVSLVTQSDSASADFPCTSEAIFTFATGPSYGFTIASGQRAKLAKLDNSMVPTCSGGPNWNPQTVNTYFDPTNYLEAGWLENSSNGLQLFVEHVQNGVVTIFTIVDPFCAGSTTDGATFSFKIEHLSFGGWKSSVGCLGTYGGFLQIGPLAATGFGAGIPRGEFEKYDHYNTTNMFQYAMEYKSGSSWSAWPSVGCWGDAMPGKRLVPYGNSAWAIELGNYGGVCVGSNVP